MHTPQHFEETRTDRLHIVEGLRDRERSDSSAMATVMNQALEYSP